MKLSKKAGIFIPIGRTPWNHEMFVAEALANAGHYVEFLPERSIPTPDIRLDGGVEYEIKSPENAQAKTIERAIKKALRQSQNIVISASRMKGAHNQRVQGFILHQVKLKRNKIKKMLFVTKKGEIIDIFNLL